jgi:hypothetical protein
MRTRAPNPIKFFIYFFIITSLAFMGILIADMDNLQRYMHVDNIRMTSAIIRTMISWMHLWIATLLFKRFKDIPTWLKIVLAVPSALLATFFAGFLGSFFVDLET